MRTECDLNPLSYHIPKYPTAFGQFFLPSRRVTDIWNPYIQLRLPSPSAVRSLKLISIRFVTIESPVSIKRCYDVAVLVLYGVYVLGFAGPIEIFSHVSLNKNSDDPDRADKIAKIGKSATIRVANSLTVLMDLLINDALCEL